MHTHLGVAIGFTEIEYVIQEDMTMDLSVGVLNGVLSPDVSITADLDFRGGTAIGRVQICTTLPVSNISEPSKHPVTTKHHKLQPLYGHPFFWSDICD